MGIRQRRLHIENQLLFPLNMKPALIVILSLIATSAIAADYTFAWDASPAEENVVGYRLKKNGEVVDSPTTTVSKPITAIPGDVFTVAAINNQGTSSPDSESLKIAPTPSAPATLRVKVVVTVEAP
jgi:hypothetical protein